MRPDSFRTFDEPTSNQEPPQRHTSPSEVSADLHQMQCATCQAALDVPRPSATAFMRLCAYGQGLMMAAIAERRGVKIVARTVLS